ncbi:MAG: hypothetical protein VX875_11050 [Pseudomonadota bacterium]|jgi:hypothetical protein|nr:hypothetical protein [Pseudomonadota bacterium]
MNHIVSQFRQSASHSITSHKIMQLPQLALQQQQLLQVLTYGASKAFCLNTLRAKQIDFLNLGGVVYCTSLQLILLFKMRRLFGFQHLTANRV